MIHRIRTIRPNLHLEHSICTRAAAALDRNSNVGQVLSQPQVVNREIDEVANPLWRKFHFSSSVILSEDLLHASEASRSRRISFISLNRRYCEEFSPQWMRERLEESVVVPAQRDPSTTQSFIFMKLLLRSG